MAQAPMLKAKLQNMIARLRVDLATLQNATKALVLDAEEALDKYLGSPSAIAAMGSLKHNHSSTALTDGDNRTFYIIEGHDAALMSVTFDAPVSVGILTIRWKADFQARRVLVLLSPSVDGSSDWFIGAKDLQSHPCACSQLDVGGHDARRMRIILADAVHTSSVVGPVIAVTEIELSACQPQQRVTWGGADSMVSGLIFTVDVPRPVPQVLRISPRRGTTAGGTRVLIEGTGFNSSERLSVHIAGVKCEVQWAHSPHDDVNVSTLVGWPAELEGAVNRTIVACITGYHGATSDAMPGFGLVELSVAVNDGVGLAAASAASAYQYVDLWSRYSSWGGSPPPTRGDTVWIRSGQALMLDVSPPYLYFLLIEGTLTFDRIDVELNCSYIFIANGGALVVGTEQEPFMQRAVITLHGSPVSQELPTYGAKLIGCRYCTLDLHGAPVLRSWTRLQGNARVGDSTICLQRQVNWDAGSSIIITSTSYWAGYSNLDETEQAVIREVSRDGYCLLLGQPLQYDHLAETRQTAGPESAESKEFRDLRQVDIRAEVALLSRNVRIQGDDDSVDQYGAQIHVHSYGHQSSTIRIENIEMWRAGQYGRSGRYPIYLNRVGYMENSYIRSSSIHHTHNRGIVLNQVNGMHISGNVIYESIGHTVFLESGMEIKNVVSNNLVVMTHESVAMLHSELTPASFHISNLNNIVSFNTASSSHGYGFWYSPAEQNGYTGIQDVYGITHCPHGTKLRSFQDNVSALVSTCLICAILLRAVHLLSQISLESCDRWRTAMPWVEWPSSP